MIEKWNWDIYKVETVCNYDKDVIPYLMSEVGSAYIRTGKDKFEIDDGSKAIFIDKQDR